MKTKFLLTVIILCSNVFFFCNSPSRITNNAQTSSDDNGSSPQWDGNYRGMMPCADCAGVETTISLNKDMTYSMKLKHSNNTDTVTERSGKFELVDKGNTVILKDPRNNNHVLSYHIGDNVLTLVDVVGNDVGHKRKDTYTLSKANYEIVGRHWKLIELNGSAVQTDSTSGKQPEIIFDDNNKVTGNGGCNSISGGYKLGNTDQISFSNLVSTRMACPNSSLENKFLKVLSKVQSYYVSYDQLALGKSKSNPMARFKAVE